jgi:hypothetical protein
VYIQLYRFEYHPATSNSSALANEIYGDSAALVNEIYGNSAA